ncbi:hypothetical protein [Acinetobacter sp. YH01012]|uniref:hypothetical protein n=1 Tax=Acinetobacter sp. YH01012 TaxID=2601028 RepID=UPI00211ED345|nr:hypothetical protein [Acinetobacter sp. YH01012]
MLFRSCVACITGLFALSLVACSSNPPHSTLNRDAYLQQFIGQSSQYILTHLQLSQIDYQQVGTVEQTKRALRYQVILNRTDSYSNGTASNHRNWRSSAKHGHPQS